MPGVMELDTSQLSESTARILRTIETDYPKEANRLMQTAGNLYKGKLSRQYRQKVGTVTGNLRRGFKRGRPYIYKVDTSYQVRVKNVAPHALLVEHGHRIVTRKGVDTGKRAKGAHLVPVSQQEFEKDFEKMCEKFVDKVIERGFTG